MLCLIKINSNTIELTVHTSCYCVLLCVTGTPCPEGNQGPPLPSQKPTVHYKLVNCSSALKTVNLILRKIN